LTGPRRFNEEIRPHFVTAITMNRGRHLANPAIASSLIECLLETRERYGFLLLSFVVMPDHLHDVVVPREGDTISQTMRFIKCTFARRFNAAQGRSGAFWQPSFYDRVIRDDQALVDVLLYIDENPVAEGLASYAHDFQFGSASGRYATDIEGYAGG